MRFPLILARKNKFKLPRPVKKANKADSMLAGIIFATTAMVGMITKDIINESLMN